MASMILHSLRQLGDANGVPYAGALITVYEAGSVTKLDVFSDAGLTVPAANPIVCPNGVCPLRFIAADSYKVSTTTATGAPLSQYSGDDLDPGIPLGTGVLAVMNGGTGADDGPEALVNLGAADASQVDALAAQVASLAGAASSVERTHLATGTTAQRPDTPIEGDARRNTTTGKFEGYTSSWENFKTSADATSTASVAAETEEDTYLRPDRLQHSQRVAKAWARVTLTAGAPVLTDGFNISASITDNGVGDYTFAFTNAMGNANYAVIGSVHYSGSATFTLSTSTAPSTTGFRVKIFDPGGPLDPTSFSLIVFGDHA
jgi:hypothetical protein